MSLVLFACVQAVLMVCYFFIHLFSFLLTNTNCCKHMLDFSSDLSLMVWARLGTSSGHSA